MASSTRTEDAGLSAAAAQATKATYATADAATVWGSMALVSGAVTLAVGWLLWEM